MRHCWLRTGLPHFQNQKAGFVLDVIGAMGCMSLLYGLCFDDDDFVDGEKSTTTPQCNTNGLSLEYVSGCCLFAFQPSYRLCLVAYLTSSINPLILYV